MSYIRRYAVTILTIHVDAGTVTGNNKYRVSEFARREYGPSTSLPLFAAFADCVECGRLSRPNLSAVLNNRDGVFKRLRARPIKRREAIAT